MKTTRLGRTGLVVSRVGIGGIPLTRPQPDDCTRLVRHALDRGITFIDTAFGYSDSEERIGRGIAGRREGIVLTTKTPARDRGTALAHLETSLRRLGTDYIDVWQLHGISTQTSMDAVLAPGGAYEAAQIAVHGGKAGHIGFSSHNIDIAIKCVETGLFSLVQFPFNFISDEAAGHLVGLCAEMDVAFVGMKPFAGGAIREAGLAFRWLLQFDNVLPDPGVERTEEIDEIISIVEAGETLTEDDTARIAEIRARLGKRFCRQCEYCMPCPQGVIIPGMLYLPRLYDLWPAERFFSWPLVTRSVATARECAGCGACEERCPYGLPIREMIQEGLRFYDGVHARWAQMRNT